MIAVDVAALAGALAALARRDPAVRRDLASALGLSQDQNVLAGSFVTVESYAAKHSIGESTVRTAMREGRLVFERIGRSVRIPADAVIAKRRPDEVLARAERRLGLGAPRRVTR